MKKVQAFYNVTFNYGNPRGCSKFRWGFDWFDLMSSDDKSLSEQLLDVIEDGDGDFDRNLIYNLNLNTFTPFPATVFEGEL